MKTILVCGGRGYNDRRKVYETLDTQEKPFRIIHGAARGADSLATDYGRDRNIPVTAFLAEWSRHGKSAGYVRNRRMLEEGPAPSGNSFPRRKRHRPHGEDGVGSGRAGDPTLLTSPPGTDSAACTARGISPPLPSPPRHFPMVNIIETTG